MTDATAGRFELVRALGAVADSPAAARAAGAALGLEPVSDTEHTDVFVMNLPPYASVYLGPDGALGGDAADRVAGFWRVLGMYPPAEPDHLAALLSLYASLGEAATAGSRPATRAALARAQATLFSEHLWPWLPAYLAALTDLSAPALAQWAQLLRRALAAQTARHPALPVLPLALRAAPAGAAGDTGARELAHVLTVPVRSGMILTRHRLAQGAAAAGVGHRIGERRFSLRAMLEQDPSATLTWLVTEADRWRSYHQSLGADDQTARWWAGRAGKTRQMLLLAQVRDG